MLAIALGVAPDSPMPSRTLAKPPEVPCPPVIDMLPAAIPIKGSTPMNLVIPIGIKFCMAIITTNKINMISSSILVIIAIDSFKGCLTSMEANEAAAEGIRMAYPDAEIIRVPVSDGGEA